MSNNTETTTSWTHLVEFIELANGLSTGLVLASERHVSRADARRAAMNHGGLGVRITRVVA